MVYELSTTEETLIVSAKSKVKVGMATEKSIQSNLEALNRFFPRMNIKQAGPVVQIYHLKGEAPHAATHEFMLETGFPIGKGKMVRLDPQSKLAVRELKKSKCAKYLFQGPVPEAPWTEFLQAVRADGLNQFREYREIYRTKATEGANGNEIEMQIILE